MNNYSNQVDQLVKEAQYLIDIKDYRNATRICSSINQRYPNFAPGWFISSSLALTLKVYDFASVAIDKALLLHPMNNSYLLQRIRCLYSLDKQSKAVKLADKLSKSKSLNASILNDLATFFSTCHKFNKASVLYKQAIKKSPSNSTFYYNLACVERFMGKLSDSENNCTSAININPLNSDAHFLRSNLIKQKPERNHISELSNFSKSYFSNPIDFCKIQFSLAKELEDCSLFEESFKARLTGAKTYRNMFQYDVKSEIEFMRSIENVYNLESMDNLASKNDGSNIIFILGLPRTGSTLVDRILSNHSSANSAGELTVFNEVMLDMLSKLPSNNNISRSQMVSLSINLDFNQLGKAYINQTKKYHIGSKIIIDKFPQNSIYAGLIHLALPNAKIILIERNPIDCCYSIFKQLFTDIYQYSYDLNELVDYYIAHQKLMNHWKAVIPDAIHVVRYEELVANTEKVSKDLLTFCKLDWQQSCLEFHKNTQSTTTASASQVRQKIYSSSIGMWKNYKKQLEPIITKLEQSSLV